MSRLPEPVTSQYLAEFTVVLNYHFTMQGATFVRTKHHAIAECLINMCIPMGYVCTTQKEAAPSLQPQSLIHT